MMSPPLAGTVPAAGVGQNSSPVFDHDAFEQNVHTALMMSTLPKEMLAPAPAPGASSEVSMMHQSDSALMGMGQFAAPLSRGELLRQCAAMSANGPAVAAPPATPMLAPLGIPLGESLRQHQHQQQQQMGIKHTVRPAMRPAMPPKQQSLKRILNPLGGGNSAMKEPSKKRSKSAGSMALFPALAMAQAELREEFFEDSCSSLDSQLVKKQVNSSNTSSNKAPRDLPSLMGSSLSSLDASSVIEETEPAPKPAVVEKPPVAPAQLIRKILKNDSKQDSDGTKEDPAHESYFVKPTPSQIAAYTTDIVSAVRNRNLPVLRQYLNQDEGGRDRLSCCNRFGESLLHMACRRGYEDVVRFLLVEAEVSIRARDDYGRTPLHDACWTARPNHALMDVLLTHGGKDAVDLLLVADVRGHVPFDYARREHWAGWNTFIEERRELFLSKGGKDRIKKQG